MKTYKAENIRNIALCGHAGSGKTSLIEGVLYRAKISDRLGRISDGNTITDYDPEEIKRKASLGCKLASFEFKGQKSDIKINLIDTPGLLDFTGGLYEGVSAADTVMIAVSGKSGVKVGTQKAYDLAETLGKAKIFVITKVDDPEANYYNVLTDLKTKFGPTVCPVIVPVIKDRQVISYINLIEKKCYTYSDNGDPVECPMPTNDINDKVEYRLEGLQAAFAEAVAETDEELMDKFFGGEEFTQDELVRGLHAGMEKGIITPVICNGTGGTAADMILKEIELLMPSPAEAKPFGTVDGGEVKNTDGKLRAFIYRTVADPFVGKMSFIRVASGTLKSNTEYFNASSEQNEKIGKLYTLIGKKQIEMDEAPAGDICVAVKINGNTSDTITDGENVKILPIEFPKPTYKMAVSAKNQGDEAKIGTGLQRLAEEDKTLEIYTDPLTHETIIAGLGEQHLESAISKLKSKFGAEVILTEPKIAYRETIRKKVRVQGRHKKQSGGHGQFGDVVIEFEPCVSDELVFEEKVFGGAVPKNYFPAVEKGLQESMKKGVLAGCPVVGLKAILVDGSYHPVDSSELAFKIAAGVAYKEGLKQADPTILEPIGKLVVTVPDENTGEIMGDLNKRRARVIGMNPAGKGMTAIEAEVPMREMHSFTMQLRQVARGNGDFTLEHLRYEQLPAALVPNVILAMQSE
ncbi:MAG: elongation factor G [Ruminococcus sp.]|nr:elongation factor G [Ruminococcus sp.]